nr:NAD-glutamate dehydrogenase [Nocardioidaceae bacterium]
VRVFTPAVEDDEWDAEGHTVIEVVTDDMPFLVDSVTMAITADDRPIHAVIHPQLLVRRDVTGQLLEVSDGDGPGAGITSDLVRESWMHIEVDRETDQDAVDAISTKLTQVLRDVREVVEDWAKMNDQAQQIVADLESNPPDLPQPEIEEGKALLSWLADNHFTFLGYREYRLQVVDGEDVLRALPGTGLGILRSDQDMSPSFGKLPPAVRAKARHKQLMIITKANSRSTVHRPVYLDYIGIKTFDEAGEVTGERRFLGLFSSAAYTESLTRIPMLRNKARALVDHAGYSPGSHSGKALMDILETYPRDELFQTPVDDLLPVAESVLHLRERRQLRFFSRRDEFGRYLSCLLYLPRDRYTTQVREKLQAILKETLGADTLDYTARVSESVLARLHFVVRAKPGETLRDFDSAELERRLTEATRSWTDDLVSAITEEFGEEDRARITRLYADAFPEAYKEDFRPQVAAADIGRVEAADPDSVGLFLYAPADAEEGVARFKVFRTGSPISLSHVLPLLSAMGVEVVDERPYELSLRSGPAWIYDFGLRREAEMPTGARELFQDAFRATWSGRAESDGFSALVLDGAIPWRQVTILRAYAKYFRQGGSPFSQEYIEASLRANVPIARLLVDLFEVRFDPAYDGDRSVAGQEIQDKITAALDDVASLDQDRILRSYLRAIDATLRTNFYQRDDDGELKSYMSLKLEPKQVPDLPEPRPAFEVFVYSPRVEGVHLRFGAVARGGLRWSDRREDFRTEVLGLVKAQMVKNAVIVPVGAKGGFYCKQMPPPSADRETMLAEGIACYKTFICALLDITDNLVDGKTVPPRDVVRHDGDDSYLVVAADKGTATFSDIANGVAKDYGYWLGDAFASGGSVGYDHKAMGITARGAWVSVQRHFRERGIDCQTTDFTVVGIGDMSGDVFGNGMLLSEHTSLVAAFDHRDIFLDPHPDPASSFAERARLFKLPRSSWADYDTSVISEGGGVFSRTLKSIPVSAEVAEALAVEEGAHLTPAELMKAILLAPVDLLWNGGIGTYVKAQAEVNADAGDKANDSIRVNGQELRCQAVGEGGNLGFTQLGRIEYAANGGRICTDFIDNSAGVDTSDHEVNIKILLDRLVHAGQMTEQEREKLLVSMTDEVGALVLSDNYDQNLALASSLAVAAPLMHVHESWIRRLERRGLVNREIEFLPTPKDFASRRQAGTALTAPELAVLLAYTKIVLADELLQSALPDDPFLRGDLFGYFPTQMRQPYREQMNEHPLRREIIVTQVVNDLVNFAGITFFHRLSQETSATAEELTRAHVVCRELYGADHLLQQVNALDNTVDASVQTRMRLSVRTLVERATRWMVNNRRPPLDSEATVEVFGTRIQQVMQALPELLCGVDHETFERSRNALTEAGVPEGLAQQVAVLPSAYAALEIAEIANRDGYDPIEVARLHARLGADLGLSQLLDKIFALPRDDRWQTMARATLRDDLHAVHAALTAQVLATTESGASVEERIESWERTEETLVGRAKSTLDEITSDDQTDLARMSVGLRVVRTMLTTA